LLKRELNADPDALTKALVAELRWQAAGEEPAVQPAARSVQAAKPHARGAAASALVFVRRQVAILACNWISSTPLSLLLPEEVDDLTIVFHKKVADTVRRFGGFPAQYQGDGILIYFGYPTAHEHDAEQAVRAALATLNAIGASIKTSSGAVVQTSVG